MAEVIIEGLSKTYPNGVQALRSFGLTVGDGERVVVVGPSGSGKSTLLRLIAGLEKPDAGRIVIGGIEATRQPPRSRDVALVFQRPTLYPHLTVRDNLAFGQKLRLANQPFGHHIRRLCWPPAWEESRKEGHDLRDRVEQAAADLGLTALLDRWPGELSGGQQQRVALGRALVRQPAAFLLDEPLSSLDAPLRAELRRQLHLLQRARNATMIYVTHDQTEALTLGDRVVVLDGGVVKQVASPAVLYDNPADRFVAGFVGWPAMNFLDGRLEWSPEGFCFATRAGSLLLPAPVAERWARFAGGEWTLGLRAEDLHPANERDGSEWAVAWVEAAAAGIVVELERNGVRMTACWPGRPTFRPGELAVIAFDMNQAHLFDRTTGRASGSSGPDLNTGGSPRRARAVGGRSKWVLAHFFCCPRRRLNVRNR